VESEEKERNLENMSNDMSNMKQWSSSKEAIKFWWGGSENWVRNEWNLGNDFVEFWNRNLKLLRDGYENWTRMKWNLYVKAAELW
jgi:hypothetical protein